MNLEPLNSSDLPTETIALARALIGCIVVHRARGGIAAGRIVETEAYPPGDPAAHHVRGRTPRNASLFLPAHHAYVYHIYGASYCFNLSSEPNGIGGGVLVRALEPLHGIARMRERRGVGELVDLCRGPGRLCAALAIDLALDGARLFGGSRLRLAAPDRASGEIGASRRIGVTRAAARLLRYYERGSRFVSGPRALSPA